MSAKRDDGENVVRRYYAAFNAGDRAGMLDCLAEDFVHDVNEGGRRKGKALFAAFMAHMDRCYREELKDIVVMASADGSRAAAEFVVHGTYVATDEGLPPARGQAYVLPAGAFFEVKSGLIARVTTYYNLKNWMEQVAR
jgi:steroid delta-isomerase-like uncharacterized protein